MTWKRANPEIRLKPLLDVLPESLNNQLWLDIGTGDGFYSNLMYKLYPNNTILRADISKHANFGNLGFKSYIEYLGIRPKSISGIICSQVLHYLDHSTQDVILHNLNQYLVDHGVLLIVEYIINKRISWIPFPVSLEKINNYAISSEVWDLVESKSILDGNRPKFSVLLQKRHST